MSADGRASGCVWASCEDQSSRTVTQGFFLALRQRRYRNAYEYLSATVRRDLSYSTFAQRSRDIVRVEILEMKSIERSAHVLRYRVRGKLRLRHDGKLFDAIYAGTAVLILQSGRWWIEEVDLKPTQQKQVPGYRV